LSFRELNGLLVYYTHLISYRCAIREVRVGIDSAVPDKVLKMPPCDPRDPSVIPHDAQPYRKLSPLTKTVSVELTYRDGSVSEIKSLDDGAFDPGIMRGPYGRMRLVATPSQAQAEGLRLHRSLSDGITPPEILLRMCNGRGQKEPEY
jgi:hypothetical protein